MTEKTLTLDVVSAEKPIFSGPVKMLSVTGSMGELGILPGHTQLLSDLKPGQIRIKNVENDEQIMYISGGMIEVQPYVVTIMADTVVRAEDIDEAAALEAKERAESALADKKGTIDKNQLIAEMAEATAMLRAVKELQKLRK